MPFTFNRLYHSLSLWISMDSSLYSLFYTLLTHYKNEGNRNVNNLWYNQLYLFQSNGFLLICVHFQQAKEYHLVFEFYSIFQLNYFLLLFSFVNYKSIKFSRIFVNFHILERLSSLLSVLHSKTKKLTKLTKKLTKL